MKDKAKKVKLNLVYNEKDICIVYGYQKFIIKHINAGNKIPARVLKKFLSFLEYEETSIKMEIEERCKPIKESVILHFGKDKNYNFKTKMYQVSFFGDIPNFEEELETEKVKPKIKRTKVDCSFEKLVDFIFSRTTQFTENRNKDELALRIYGTINEYFSLFASDTKQVFSEYKRIVLVAFILHKFNFSLSKEINELKKNIEPTNQLLFQSLKYQLTTKRKSKNSTNKVVSG